MAEDPSRSSSHSQSPRQSPRSPGDDRPRLTEEEKKANHIASEQKRRQAIRDGFDALCARVPGLEGHGRSEGHVLKKTVEFMKEQLYENRRLIQEREAEGKTIPPEWLKFAEALERIEAYEALKKKEEQEKGVESET